jgi:L-aspartate oxidase
MTDYLVLGSGIAGLSFALRAANNGHVILVTKRTGNDAATGWAQGGVAAALSEGDSFDQHASDTHGAGGGLCHERVVDLCVRGGPAAIEWLLEVGARFSRTPAGSLDLAREGGHSARRVVHAGDLTGQEIQRALLQAASEHPNIELREWHMGVDLITLSQFGGPDRCVGAYVFDEAKGRIEAITARATVLATGGAGKVYLYTTNPDVATGDGVAMAYRAGAWLGNMEFYQFHPTCLFHPSAKSFLISEALRGEGARLCLPTGEPFMAQHHALGDLAPRDVVARAIDYEMKRTGSEYVVLDISHKPASFVRERFPGIYEKCQSLGIDITTQPIPVVPAAHYMCGGVSADLDGRTSLPGLWVLGETAFTGLHGANRLASNSLLEGLVFAHRAADKLAVSIEGLRQQPAPSIPDWETGSAVASDEAVVVTHNWDELRRTMWNYVGIVRTYQRLERAVADMRELGSRLTKFYHEATISKPIVELFHGQQCAGIIATAALRNPVSRGAHFRRD